MTSEFQTVQLEEVADLKGGYAFKSQDYTESGRFVLRTLNIDDSGRITRDSAAYISEEKAKEYERFELVPWDTLFVMVGATLGKVGLIKESDLPALLNQNMWVVRAKKERVNPRYLHYAFGLTSKSLLGWASGAARDFVRRDDFRKMHLNLPARPQQDQIAHILGTLDDKIELNRRMNETLEAIARAIFKSWFIDFDPVRAKASGESPESICRRLGLTPDLLALFPDRLVDSELGEIPESWRIGTVDEEFDLTMGQSPPGSTYNDAGEGLPFYQGSTDFGFRFPSRRIFCTAPTRFAEAGDALISVRAPVGDINMADERCCIGRGVAAAHHKSGSRSYTYYFMQSIEDVFNRFEADGTVFGSISKKDFHNIERPMPQLEIVQTFERFVSPMDDQIANTSRQSRTLSALRNTLLPKLLSGELRVPTEGLT